MEASGMDNTNMCIYHMRTLTTSFVEFGGCTLYIDAKDP